MSPEGSGCERPWIDRDDDLAVRPTFVDAAERLDNLAERIPGIDRQLDQAGRDQVLEPLHVWAVERLPTQQQPGPDDR